MLDFIQNIGSRVLNFFSERLGIEGTKRPFDSFADEEQVTSSAKRLKLQMEHVSQSRSRLPTYEDRRYTTVNQSLASRNAMPSGNLRECITTDSTWTTSEHVGTSRSKLVSRSDGSGYNFASASQGVRSNDPFQFSTSKDMRFQGMRPQSSMNSPVASRSLASNGSRPRPLTPIPRSNGTFENKEKSVLTRFFCKDKPRRFKCIEARKRDKMAVKQCFRLQEKNLYQDLLSRHLTQHKENSYLPPTVTVERHYWPKTQKSMEDKACNDSSLFNNLGGYSSTNLDDMQNESLKRRLDSTTSFLKSVASTANSSSLATLPSPRLSLSQQKQKTQNEFPERTLQTLQKLQQWNQPIRTTEETNNVDRSSLNNMDRSSVSESLSSKRIPPQKERQNNFLVPSVEKRGASRKSSTDSDPVIILDDTPASPSSDSKASISESVLVKRSLMPEAFEKAMKESRYTSKDFLLQLNSKTKADFRKQNIIETETTVEYYKNQRKTSEDQLINKVNKILHISEKLGAPAEEIFVEEVIEEISDDDDVQEIEEIEDDEEDDDVEEITDEFIELTDEQESIVRRALVPRPPDEILSDAFRLQITRKDLATLSGLNWLNDEVINFYFNLIMARCESQTNYPKVYAFSTFFYPKVAKEGHKAVRRWTKSVDLFSFDYVLIPVHLGNHWCLAAVDFRKRELRYYDSMGMENKECLQILRRYLSEEFQTKHQTNYDWNGWQFFCVKNIPQQMNGSDCGMFACKFGEYISRDVPITFDQLHMPYFRRRMVYEIVTKRLL